MAFCPCADLIRFKFANVYRCICTTVDYEASFTQWPSRPIYHFDLDLKLKILKHENFHGNGMKSLYNGNHIGMIK